MPSGYLALVARSRLSRTAIATPALVWLAGQRFSASASLAHPPASDYWWRRVSYSACWPLRGSRRERAAGAAGLVEALRPHQSRWQSSHLSHSSGPPGLPSPSPHAPIPSSLSRSPSQPSPSPPGEVVVCSLCKSEERFILVTILTIFFPSAVPSALPQAPLMGRCSPWLLPAT